MRARIHRGAHEIGGNCVELEHDGQRVVLDVGRPLNVARDEFVPLPSIDPGSASLHGVLITHHHADHWGLVDQVIAETPVWMGAATQRILEAAAFWTNGLDIPLSGQLQHRIPLELGPFTITPYLNDHSAFDAYSLLVEAGERRLFYTGDIWALAARRASSRSWCASRPATCMSFSWKEPTSGLKLSPNRL